MRATAEKLSSSEDRINPLEGPTIRQKEKWLQERTVLFEMEHKNYRRTVDKSITLEQYVKLWQRNIALHNLAKSTLAREDLVIARILPHLSHYKLTELRPEHFQRFYTDMRTVYTSLPK